MIDATPTPALLELAARKGVSCEFTDWHGETRAVPTATLLAVLAAFDLDVADEAAIAAALRDADDAPWRRTLPAAIVEREGRTREIPVHVPHGEPVAVEAVLEDGGRRPLRQLDRPAEPREIDGVLIGRATFELPGDLPLGWHRLEARVGERPGAGEVASGFLTIVPPMLRSAAALDRTPRTGLMAQSYQLRSRDSWGIGDAADAGTLAEWAAGEGADFLLVNPLHAPAPVSPIEPSPYLPTTRRFLDPIAIRVEDVPGLARVDAAAAARVRELGDALRAENELDRIDRDAVWHGKAEALELIRPADLADPSRRRAFGEFCDREGQGLVDFATYCAIAGLHGSVWTAWPEGLRHPESADIAAFRAEHAEEVDRWRWLQWIAAEQLEALQRRARDAGMAIGVIHDLAVGVHPAGADAWSMPTALARGVTVGAPPDMFNQLGQNWSQPPWRPDRLEELGYAPYRDMLRTVLRAAGGLRIDHILGLFRLWWVPQGRQPVDGTYVRYDHEALLGILALEAERAGALVIGEDMGVVPEITRSALLEHGIDGTSVLWFEQEEDGAPLPPEGYRERCLASVTTHDLPPTLGYLALEQIDLRERLGLLTVDPAEEREREQGAIDRVVRELVRRGEAREGADRRELVLALHRFLAASRARLVAASVADLAGDVRSVNVPGTYREYPNWCVPLADGEGELVALEELLGSPWAREVLAAAARPGGERLDPFA